MITESEDEHFEISFPSSDVSIIIITHHNS